MGLGLIITGVGEVIGALDGRDGFEDRTDRIVDGLGGSLCGLAQPMFQFGEELFDRVQIGRVFRQEEEVSARSTDSAADRIAFVRAEIDGVDAP